MRREEKYKDLQLNYTPFLRQPVSPEICNFPILLGIILIMFCSCNKIQDPFSQKDEKKKIQLTEKTLFDYKIVKRVRRGAEEEERTKGLEMLNEALKTSKESNRTFRSLELIKESVLIYPSPNGYFYLGNVYLSLGDLHQAEKCYKMAELLNFRELKHLYFMLSKTYSAQNKTKEAVEYLKYAIDKGYTNLSKLSSDKDFKNLKKKEEFREIIANMTDLNDSKTILFDIYLSKFPKLSLPFSVNIENVESFNYENYIPYDYEEFVNNDNDKEEGKEYSFVGIIDSTKKYIAAIYSSIDAVEEDYPATVKTYIVVYDSKGKVIDKLLFAGNINPELSFSGEIDEKKAIKIGEYRNIWKYDPATTDFIDNEVERTVLETNHYFKISSSGRIKELPKKEDEGIVAKVYQSI